MLGWIEIEMNRHKLLLPDDAFCSRHSRQVVMSQAQHEVALRIARLSDAILRRDIPGLDEQSACDAHRSNAVRSGLLRSNGRIRVESLNQKLNSYCANMPTCGEYLMLRTKMESWALKLLRKSRGRAIHPLTHIVLLDCLSEGSEVRSREKIDKKTLCSNLIRQPLPIDLGQLAEMISVRNFTLSQAAAALGVSVTTAVVAAKRAGLSISSRPKTINDDVKNSIVNSLRSGLNLKDIASKHGISLVSVYRIIRMDANLELEFEAKKLELDRERYRNRFLISHGDKASYAWLRRHDAGWLAQQIGLGKKFRTTHAGVDWEKRDGMLSQKIVDSESELRGRPGKPVYISETLLKRLTKMSDTISQNIDKLPLTNAALKTCAESPESCQRRRLVWACGELERQLQYHPPRWHLLRVAGVRQVYLENQELITTMLACTPYQDISGEK